MDPIPRDPPVTSPVLPASVHRSLVLPTYVLAPGSDRFEAAVDEQVYAGDVGGLVRGQVQHRI
jgi:hypothetical protein